MFKSIIAITATASLLVLAGCGNGTTASSAGAGGVELGKYKPATTTASGLKVTCKFDKTFPPPAPFSGSCKVTKASKTTPDVTDCNTYQGNGTVGIGADEFGWDVERTPAGCTFKASSRVADGDCGQTGQSCLLGTNMEIRLYDGQIIVLIAIWNLNTRSVGITYLDGI